MSSFDARRGFLLAAADLALAPMLGHARDAAPVVLAEQARPTGSDVELRLLGSGTFQLLFLRYYTCGLYAFAGLTDAESILARDAPRRIQLVALIRITSFEFFWGLDKGLKDNMDEAQAQRLSAPLEQIRATIREVGAIPAGTSVCIDYTPASGTAILVDGALRGSAVAGKPLNDALMRVWLGKRPLDASLKKALLGGHV